MTEELAAQVAALDWYHTMELPGGVVTPGFFDHRGVLSRYDLPTHLAGKRVLDVGTFDGFFAFEFERRGAAEVVACDVPSAESLDFAVPFREEGITRFQPQHKNFELAQRAYGSKVVREFVSVYDVSPERLGTFDIVYVGSLLCHLRDPVGALMALRSVVGGEIILGEAVHRQLDLVRSFPLARLQAISPHLTWWIPNRRALVEMLLAAGFKEPQVGKGFVVPFRDSRKGVYHAVIRATV